MSKTSNFSTLFRRLLPAFSKSPFKKDEENEENPVPEMIEENEASPLNDASAPSNHQSRISEAHSTVSVKRFETYPSENKWTDLVKLPLASGV